MFSFDMRINREDGMVFERIHQNVDVNKIRDFRRRYYCFTISDGRSQVGPVSDLGFLWPSCYMHIFEDRDDLLYEELRKTVDEISCNRLSSECRFDALPINDPRFCPRDVMIDSGYDFNSLFEYQYSKEDVEMAIRYNPALKEGYYGWDA